jgi:hypothetical protein
LQGFINLKSGTSAFYLKIVCAPGQIIGGGISFQPGSLGNHHTTFFYYLISTRVEGPVYVMLIPDHDESMVDRQVPLPSMANMLIFSSSRPLLFLISHTVHCISGPLFIVTNNAGVDPLGTTFYPPTESVGNLECYERIFYINIAFCLKLIPHDSSSFGETISRSDL